MQLPRDYWISVCVDFSSCVSSDCSSTLSLTAILLQAFEDAPGFILPSPVRVIFTEAKWTGAAACSRTGIPELVLFFRVKVHYLNCVGSGLVVAHQVLI